MIYTVKRSESHSFVAKDGNTIKGYKIVAENVKGESVAGFISERHADVCPICKGDKLDLALSKWGKILDVFPAETD